MIRIAARSTPYWHVLLSVITLLLMKLRCYYPKAVFLRTREGNYDLLFWSVEIPSRAACDRESPRGGSNQARACAANFSYQGGRVIPSAVGTLTNIRKLCSLSDARLIEELTLHPTGWKTIKALDNLL